MVNIALEDYLPSPSPPPPSTPILPLTVQMRAQMPVPLMHPMPGAPPMPTPLMAGMPPRPHPPPVGEDPAAKRVRSDQDHFIPEEQFIAQHPVSVLGRGGGVWAGVTGGEFTMTYLLSLILCIGSCDVQGTDSKCSRQARIELERTSVVSHIANH